MVGGRETAVERRSPLRDGSYVESWWHIEQGDERLYLFGQVDEATLPLDPLVDPFTRAALTSSYSGRSGGSTMSASSGSRCLDTPSRPHVGRHGWKQASGRAQDLVPGL